MRPVSSRLSTGSRRVRAIRLRRVMLTVLAGGLIVAAGLAATMSASIKAQGKAHHPVARRAPIPRSRYTGEPQLPQASATPLGAELAARRFVRDYGSWNGRQLQTIPAADATSRVLAVIEQGVRQPAVASVDAVDSVRMARVGPGQYVVTSAIGNFLLGRQGSQWLVVSVPGD
jgi:hypothetical protein